MATNVCRRHPLYATFIFVVVSGTFFLLLRPAAPAWNRAIHAHDLSTRLVQSEQIYSRMLEARRKLIKKFGPTPKDIVLFPPDVKPWPAYTVWDFFPSAFNCPHEVQRLGALADGGKWVCGVSRLVSKSECVVYSVGINYESSFEADLLSTTHGCEVWGYDPAVTSFGPQIPSGLLPRTHFFPYGLAGSSSSESTHTPPIMHTLETLMKQNGHTHIDILKIDIEHAEFATLTDLIMPYITSGRPLPFGQLLVEIHLWEMSSFVDVIAWWEMLEAAGLRPFKDEPNLVYHNYNRESSADLAEYSFLNIKGSNAFISHD